MKQTDHHRFRTAIFLAALAATGVTATACSKGAAPAGSATSARAAGTTGAPNATGPVLPVAANPIDNASTVQALKIDQAIVENNLTNSGKPADDHLEIVLANTGATDLTGVEVFYVFTDPAARLTERYYVRLPGTFTIPAGAKRSVHFDDSGATDHFPVNKFSLYYTDRSALDVSVTVSAAGAAPQTTTLKKDAGGPEAAD